MKISMPLIDSTATLDVGTPMTEENFDYMLEQLRSMRYGLTNTKPKSAATVAVHATPWADKMTVDQRHALIRIGFTPADIYGMTPARADAEIEKARHAKT